MNSIEKAREQIAKERNGEIERVLDLIAQSQEIDREHVAEMTARTAEKLGCDIDTAILKRWGIDIGKRLDDRKVERLHEAAREYDPNAEWKKQAEAGPPERSKPHVQKLGRALQVNNDGQ